MSKYFSLEDLGRALESFSQVDGKTFLVTLVLAANGVDSKRPVNIQEKGFLGTEPYLNRFFDGETIGLHPRRPGGTCNMRPVFADLKAKNEPDQKINIDFAKLWGSTLSQSGLPGLRDGEMLMRTQGSVHQLAPSFSGQLPNRIGAGFHFEAFLTWAYAFNGIPDEITSWSELYSLFESEHTRSGIPDEYKPSFAVSTLGAWPWPSSFVSERPSNEEFRGYLLPAMLSGVSITAAEYVAVRDEVLSLMQGEFIGIDADEIRRTASSIVAALQSSKRLFLLGDPGTGKSRIARLVSTAFENIFGSRMHSVFVPISESTTPDKLFGFSTLDGRWVNGSLTSEDEQDNRQLLYSLDDDRREQINIIILDEANRQDIEELVSRIQPALDADATEPDHVAYTVSLDNSGEKRISLNTFIIMTGNSPREDAGRMVQSRPFKRRHNLVPIGNPFVHILGTSGTQFSTAMLELNTHVTERINFDTGLLSSLDALLVQYDFEPLKDLLVLLERQGVPISFGLMEKLWRTVASHFTFSKDVAASIDSALADAVLPVLALDSRASGMDLREALQNARPETLLSFGVFFDKAMTLLESPDVFGRARPFL